VLSGKDPDTRYTRLTSNDRRAVIEILKDTLPDLTEEFMSYSAQ